jgi:teichuronic acid biosynthesis glycosyltransferase TuaC
MKILHVTNMYPNRANPRSGTFIKILITGLKKSGTVNGHLVIRKKDYFIGPILVYRKIKTEGYTLVHAHHGISGVIASLPSFLLRKPLVISYVGNDVYGQSFSDSLSKKQYLVSLILYYLNIITSRTAKIVIVRNLEMKERLKRNDAIVMTSPIDMDLFKPIPRTVCKERLGLDQKKKYALFTTAPETEGKRFHLFDKAIKLLQSQGIGVASLVVYNKQHDEMPFYINASDVVVLTSFAEGSPNIIKEALSCNIPVVTVDVGDVKTVLAGVKGCYISKADSKDIAAKILKVILANSNIEGRQYIKKYSLKTVCSSLIAIYRDISNK